MATAFDLANPPATKCFWGCVHIFNKQAVAHRLAVASLKFVYGSVRDVIGTGPIVTSVAAKGPSGALITYGDGVDFGGLVLRSTYGFEICYKDCGDGLASNSAVGPFFSANVTSSTDTTVTIEGPGHSSGPVQMVRYGFDDMPSIFYGTQIAVCESTSAAAPLMRIDKSKFNIEMISFATDRQQGGTPRHPWRVQCDSRAQLR
eukprot:SAG31_NODE_5006_length_2806_cov_2.510898_1_plen_203_part_00